MKTEDIPYDYTYCYATDEQCPKAVHCLCSHAARLNEEQAISLNSRFTGDQKLSLIHISEPTRPY